MEFNTEEDGCLEFIRSLNLMEVIASRTQQGMILIWLQEKPKKLLGGGIKLPNNTLQYFQRDLYMNYQMSCFLVYVPTSYIFWCFRLSVMVDVIASFLIWYSWLKRLNASLLQNWHPPHANENTELNISNHNDSFVPRTLREDNDPLDFLVIMHFIEFFAHTYRTILPGCFLHAKAISAMPMIDQLFIQSNKFTLFPFSIKHIYKHLCVYGEKYDKMIAVCEYRHHMVWLRYVCLAKKNENKEVVVDDFLPHDKAIEAVSHSMMRLLWMCRRYLKALDQALFGIKRGHIQSKARYCLSVFLDTFSNLCYFSRTVQMRTIIEIENARTNLGHLFFMLKNIIYNHI
ncbi:hypothetical protein LXL04_003699 [Taraxacum kok-saghyz]